MHDHPSPFETSHLLHTIIESAPIRIFWKDRESRYLGANSLFARDAGLESPAGLIGRTDFDLSWRDHAERYRADDRAVMESGRERIGFVEPQTTPDGQTIWLRTSKVPLRDASGRTIGILGTYDDITASFESARALEDSEERFKLAMAGANDGLWDWNLETDEVYYSPRWQEMLGYAPGELPATLDTWSRLVHADDRDMVLARVRDYLADRRDSFEVEMRMRHRDGHEVLVLSRALKVARRPGAGATRLVGTHVDISALKQAQERDRRSTQFLQQLFVSASEGISVCEDCAEFPFVRFSLWNDRMTEITGYTMEQINRSGWYQTMYPDPALQERAAARMGRMRTGDNLVDERWVVTNRAGEPRTLLISTSLVENSAGQPAVVALMRDITELDKAEAAARREIEVREELLERASEGVVVWRRAGGDRFAEFLSWNRRMIEITGYTMEEINRLGWLEALYPDDEAREAAHRVMNEVVDGAVIRGRASRIVARDGSLRHVSISSSAVSGAGGERHVLGVVQDQTDRIELEKQLRHSQKMEAVGTLVGGIAHDFNNVLAAIAGNVFLAQEEAHDPTRVRELLGHIATLGDRASETVRQLLTFARKGDLDMRDLDIDRFLGEAFRLAETLIPGNIERHLASPGHELCVAADMTQLQQVLLNLVQNAVDAVGGAAQPRIECRLEAYDADAGFRERHPDVGTDAFVRLSVADNGSGMSAEVQGKVFEPFFTTKEVGKGTGMGLATVYGAVTSHGGVIDVDSAEGAGTTVSVYLPRVRCGKAPAVRRSGPAESGDGLTVLVVDDNRDVREVTRDVLIARGFRVLEADDGRHALEVLGGSGLRVDLVVTDVVMPRMGGVELLQEARRLEPGLPFVLLTGYDRDRVIGNEMPPGGWQVVNKPFDFDDLVRVIRELAAAP